MNIIFNNIYVVKISGKNNKLLLNRLIKFHIHMENIIKYDDYFLLYLDSVNYEKVIKYKTSYDIELVDIRGINKYKLFFRNYCLFFINVLLGIMLLFFLSNIIFDVEVVSQDISMKTLLMNELERHGISKYHFRISFDRKEEIRKKILEDNKERLEWIEIERVGTKYIIRYEERIINNKNVFNSPSNIVAKKNGVIRKILAESGSIVKSVNDYVKVGDVIISGDIIHNEEVVNQIRSRGKVYAETWYTVEIEVPLIYYEEVKTGRSKTFYGIKFLDNYYHLFGFFKYDKYLIDDDIIYSDKLLPFSFVKSKISEIFVKDEVYTRDMAVNLAYTKAEEKLFTIIPSDSQIISKNKLKIIENDSRIIVELFYKVYEDITKEELIVVNEDESIQE